MEMIYVNSSNIKAIGYDKNNSVLAIEFLNNRMYEYYGVPQYEYDNLMATDSKGKYANEQIYKFYQQQRIR